MSTQERFAELWTDYLEGELDESGIAELHALLATDEDLLKLAADLFRTHRLLGLVAAEEPMRHEAFVRDTLAQLPDDNDRFSAGVMQRLVAYSHQQSPADGLAEGADVAPRGGCEKIGTGTSQLREIPAKHRHPLGASPIFSQPRGVLRRVIRHSGWIVAALSMGALMVAYYQATHRSEMVSETPQRPAAVPLDTVRFVSLARARFFGELSPPLQSALTPHRDYVLMSGLVEVAFPAGATAIIESPAVFRILSEECLALDVGRCSVHAPEGAEGFRVETPVTRVVDRGTKFTVSVTETSDTEVQVIEGAADVYRQPEESSTKPPSLSPSDQAFEVRLTSNEAKKFAHVGEFSADSVVFNPHVYLRRLPDRVVGYHATKGSGGRAEKLVSVTVQRGGRVSEVPFSEIIPAEVTWFKGQPGFAYLASEGALPQPRRHTFSDSSLITGVINPGGSREPLASDPVMESSSDSPEATTPGLAIRFQTAVVNGPGPDVVFFDLQTFSNPPDGDAFHVSPLKFNAGLKSHTIRVYDITMESPGALDLDEFQIHMFDEPVESLTMLEDAACTSRSAGMKFRGLVVGIDLSDLGYELGERVEGLFFQDALDDDSIVDPVFIGGLPVIEGSNP